MPKTSIFINNILLHWRFSVNFVKCLRLPFLRKTSGRLLLEFNRFIMAIIFFNLSLRFLILTTAIYKGMHFLDRGEHAEL